MEQRLRVSGAHRRRRKSVDVRNEDSDEIARENQTAGGQPLADQFVSLRQGAKRLSGMEPDPDRNVPYAETFWRAGIYIAGGKVSANVAPRPGSLVTSMLPP